MVSSLPDDIINETVLQFSSTPVGCSMCSIFSVSIIDPIARRQPGSSNLLEVLSQTMKTRVFPNLNARPLSRLRLYTNGRWRLMMTGAKNQQKRFVEDGFSFSFWYPSKADLSLFVVDGIVVDSRYASTSSCWRPFSQCTYNSLISID